MSASRRAYQREWYAVNRGRWQEYHRANRDRILRRQKAYRAAHVEELRTQQRAWRIRRRDENVAIVLAAKAAGCVDCGVSDVRVLDFDHVRGTKVAAVVYLAHSNASRIKLETEIAKCEVRCANCHRIKTSERRRGRAT